MFKKINGKEWVLLRNRIIELRKPKKITQQELADAVGVTRQTIISLENGKYNASLQLAYKLSRFFEQKIEDIFIFEEE
jgi:putative transcriptional regulator